MIIGNEENFEDLINDELVLVDFFATWCGPCKMLGPVLEEYSENRTDIKLVKIDVDECENICKKYGIMSVPTLILFKNGQEISKNVGFINKEQLNSFIEENK